MSVYSRLLSTADRLIAKYGVQYTFTTTVQGAYDPATGSPGSTTSTTYTADCVRDEYSTFEKNNASVEVNDIKMIGEVAPYILDDTVTIDSDVYRIVSIDPIKPGPTVLAYMLQLRK